MVELNTQQLIALSKIKEFIADDSLDVFILRGSAGTGKTTLIAKLAQYLQRNQQSFALLAPTGRASRILGVKINQLSNVQAESCTIHRMIYQLDKIVANDNEILSDNDPVLRFYYPLKEEESFVNLLIIDESSMIGDNKNDADFIQFGSSRLLKDILEYCRISRFNRQHDHTTKILFVGDMAQLPPIGENFSPALSEEYLLKEYGVKSSAFDLTKVMRQSSNSSVLAQASIIRNSIIENKFNNFEIKINNHDVCSMNSNQSLDWIVENIANKRSSVAVVYSNASALEYNRSIRERLHGNAGMPIQIGDLLLINKNSTLHQLSNGDLTKVVSVNSNKEKYSVKLKIKNKNEIKEVLVDLFFRGITIAYRSIDKDVIVDCFILENLLDSPNRELSALELRALYVNFRRRYPELKPNTEEFKKAIRSDLHFNALQVKYGYAITCHKAQGGEWQNVLVDFVGIRGLQSKNFFHWAYTAITRTSNKLIVVNPPKFNALSTMRWEGELLEGVQINGGGSDGYIESSQDKNILEKHSDDKMTFPVHLKDIEGYHQKLILAWNELGFSVVNLEHLQYCERYTVLCENQRVQVQYYYNSKFNISRYEIVANQTIDRKLSDRILSAFSNITDFKKNTNNIFIDDFVQKLDEILSKTSIKRGDFRIMPYRLRVAFYDDARKGEIDFNFNGKENWTTVQEVGGIGATNGLFQEISLMIKNT